MAITTDILESWRRPSAVIRRKLARGENEAGALVTLMGACALFFVARWPALSRQAWENAQTGLPPTEAATLQTLLGINMFAMIFVAPFLFYTVALLSYGVLRLFRSPIRPYGARLALFWALLAISPAVLFQGLVAGFSGPGPALTLVAMLVMGAFLWLWLLMLREAAR